MEQKKPGFFAQLREKIRAYREMRMLIRMFEIMEKTDRKLTKAIEEADELIQSGETDDEEYAEFDPQGTARGRNASGERTLSRSAIYQSQNN